MKAQNVVGNS